MKVELSRFRVAAGKSARVDEWLSMLNDRLGEARETLEREQMKLEVIFREVIDGREFLYWFSIQGEDGAPVTTSPFDVDRRHLEFHEECIDHEYGMRDAQPQVILVPEGVAEAMQWPDPRASTITFQRREIVRKRRT